ncbi:MAG: cytochrome c biogenesis protein CcsA, partial [Bacteroidota bacterium]
MNFLKILFNRLFSTSAAGLYTLLIAIAIGAATFVENDFGTNSAQKIIFKTRWFELLLALFCVSLIVNIFRFRMVQMRKWTQLVFHASMIVILIGAGVTRYFGYEGMMGIREGSASNTFLSSETHLQFELLHEGKRFGFAEKVLFATLGDHDFKESYLIGDKELSLEVLRFIPNPTEAMVDDPNGVPTLKVVIGGMNGREEFLVKQGDRANIYGTLFNFGNAEDPAAFNIKYERDSLFFKAPKPFTQMVMATQKVDTIPPGVYRPLMLRSMYASGAERFVFGEFRPKASATVESTSEKMTSTSSGGLEVKVTFGGEERKLFITGSQGIQGKPGIARFGNSSLAVAYGAKPIELPFSIKLRDFIMERYPGTNNASSYASEVTLMDDRKNLVRDQRIFMNNILDYNGYRFFQSSFDQDELGTYLSVNHDFWGTWISYIGYALLTIGLVMTFFNKHSRFQQLAQNLKRMRQAQKTESSMTAEGVGVNGAMASLKSISRFLGKKGMKAVPILAAIFLAISTPTSADESKPVISKEHAARFGRIQMQDIRGRMKPLNTYASEVMRKLARKESLLGQTPEQIVLGMAVNPTEWYHVPLIKIGKHEEIANILGVETGQLAAYADFFGQNGEYKLQDYVRNAYNMPQRDRGVFEKELVKVDEKLNVASMIFSGRFLKVFPVPGDSTLTWLSPAETAHQHGGASTGGSILEQFYPAYTSTLRNSIQTGDWKLADQMLAELSRYQQKHGGEIMVSEAKINAEIFLNKLNAFSRLGKLYALLGLAFLGLLFTSVFKPKHNFKLAGNIAFGILSFGFLMHTTGLGLRWYVSGQAPWSNGYESMIYIGWTTVLAGLIFGRKNFGGLAATTVLASTILMVAGMSWLDPEITPLVPVLKSYWLMIHVSLEAGSYGFLMLGAIIGVLNLIFMIFANQKNGENVYRIVKEMTMISEMTLIGGLVMLSIGTYLGGVWANESWGRYWGWDAKETWALVTILVYSFILHMRFIPGFRGVYAFNVATLFGWASVVMTYFGVNYYLSGLHSYAAGDPV